MKFPIYSWLEPEPNIDLAYSETIPIDPILVEILNHRGFFTAESITSFINIDEYKPASAFEIPNMEASAQLVINAIKNEAPICIYGLSDIDSQIAVSILVDGLKKISKSVNVTYAQFKQWQFQEKIASSGNDLFIFCGDYYNNQKLIHKQ